MSIVCLFLLVLILIQLPSVQNFGRKKIVSFLEKKIGTPVQINRLDIDFPKLIVLEGVYFQDQQKDTLIAGKKLKVDISLFKLLKNTVEINEISLEGINANINRNAAGIFNFDYIINAFTSKKPDTFPKDSTPMVISLDEINLDKINIRYKDDFIGYDVRFVLNHFDTDIKTFDLVKSKYATGDITLEGVNATIRQYKPLVEKITQENSSLKPDSINSNANMDIDFGDINFSRINVDYKNEIDSVFSMLKLGKLHIEPDKLNLANESLKLKQILLENTTANIYLGKKPAAQATAKNINAVTDSVTLTLQKQPWKIAIGEILLKNNTLVYNDNGQPALQMGIDFSHLDVKKLNADVADLYYEQDSIRGNINNISFAEKSGLDIRKIRTEFLYTNTGASLRDLYIETPGTKIQRSIKVGYPSIETVSKNIGLLQVDADLTGSVIALKDALYFAPFLASNDAFKKIAGATIRTDIVVSGRVSNLFIPRFEVDGLRNTSIKLSGRITGLPDANRLATNLNIINLSTTSSDIFAFVPPSAIPQSINLPASLSLNGKIQGNAQNLITNLNLHTSYGNGTLNAKLSNIADSINAVYNAQVALSSFDAGKLTKNEQQIGNITFHANVIGKGYTPSRMQVAAKGSVESAFVKGYNFRNLVFDASGAKGIYQATASIADTNININLVAKANLNGKTPSINTTVMVDSISLLPLHFTTTDVRIHSRIQANIPALDPDNLQGKIEITELLVNAAGKRYISDTIVVNATRSDTGNTITLTSPILSAGLNGKYTLSGIGNAAQSLINRYYHTGNPPQTKVVPQNASFYVSMFNSPFLHELMPNLSLSDSVTISGHMNTDANQLVINGKIPALKYGSNQVSGGIIRINTTDTALVYSFAVTELSGGSFQIPSATINGAIANNTINYNVSVRDEGKKEKYLIAGNIHEQNGSYQLRILQNGLKLNYDLWTVNTQNLIEFGNAGIRATSFDISNAGQDLLIASQSPNYNAPLSLNFKNFQIESLTRIAGKDSLLIGGLINGNALISNLEKDPLFDANLTVKNFNYKKDTLGDIVIKANNKNANSYSADIAITGNGNSIKATGSYYTANSGSFDFDVLLEKVNLASVESLTAGSLKQMSGTMEGRMKITGTINNPKINGNIDFKTARVNVAILNSLFTLNDERISFQDDGIHFDKFTIKDSVNNTATINGAVLTSDYRNYRFNLDIDANNFRMLNSQKKDNPLYYGTLFVDASIKIRGDLDKPEVNADLRINDKTSLTIVLPQSDPQVAARDGIVVFFDQDHEELDSILLAPYDSSFNKSAIKGLDVAANIEVDKNAEFTMIIDEANGDFVKIRGEGSLSGGIDASGKLSLTGTYLIHEGAYEMSFNTLRRKFTIQDGSSLTWTGEPTSANVDVTAIYVANAAPIDLVEQQLSDVSETIRNTYKQKLPFNVLLTMKGELLTPDISFDIVLPEKNYTVSTDIVNASNTRLTQIRQEPGEINKQVFALLLLNRFVAEDPFSSAGGSTNVATMAKQSVSRLLSEQLNKLAADLIKGVDINLGLETTQDYTTGQSKDRTDLNVGVSKRLLNDRLNVSVGSNFELEGPLQTNQRTNNIAGNIQVDYKLTKDGRLMLRGYRVDQYEVAIQGQVVETGLTFILNVDYDKLSEILRSRKNNKAIKKEIKEERKDLQTEKQPANNL